MSSNLEKMDAESPLDIKHEVNEELHITENGQENALETHKEGIEGEREIAATAHPSMNIKQEVNEELLINENGQENVLETHKEGIEGEREIAATAHPSMNKNFQLKDIKIQVINEKLVELSIDGISVDDEEIILSSGEMHTYLKKKVQEMMADPANNPLVALTNRSKQLTKELKKKHQEFIKLQKFFETSSRTQANFLRQMGVLEKNPQESLLRKDVIGRNKAVFAKKSASDNTNAPLRVPQSAHVTKKRRKPVQTGKKPAPSSSAIECIDLTDEADIPNTSVARSAFAAGVMNHPAPLPPRPFSVPNRALPNVPPKPRLTVHAEEQSIVLQWDMLPSTRQNEYAQPRTYDLFGYHEQANLPINSMLWEKIGSVKAMTLPIACTLTQFIEGNRYHFAIRAVDVYGRFGSYSDPVSIVYTVRNNKDT